MVTARMSLDFRFWLSFGIVQQTVYGHEYKLDFNVNNYENSYLSFFKGMENGLILVTCKSVRRTERNIQDQCVQVLHIDCVHHYVPEGDETICCSNNMTYANLCEYAKAKCQGQHMHIYYLGACINHSSNPEQTTPFMSTVGTTKHFHLSQRIEELFCSQRDSIPCDTTLNPVCATDGKFYQNSCEYTKARCVNPTLLLQELEMCKT